MPLITMFIAVLAAGGQGQGSYTIQGFESLEACRSAEAPVKAELKEVYHSSYTIKTRCASVPKSVAAK